MKTCSMHNDNTLLFCVLTLIKQPCLIELFLHTSFGFVFPQKRFTPFSFHRVRTGHGKPEKSGNFAFSFSRP